MTHKIKKIVVYGEDFIEWGGGVDFLKNLIEGMLTLENTEITFLVRKHRCFNYSRPMRALMQFCPGFLIRIFFPKKIEALKPYADKIKFCFCNSISRALKSISPDVIVPSLARREFDYPWVGYLYDCQHKYLPELFVQEAIIGRDKYFTDMLASAPALIVNSIDTKKDLMKFFNASEEKVFNLPFAPILKNVDWLDDKKECLQKFNLRSKYFVVSNQFWQHKSHETAFRALGVLKHELGEKDVKLVCTGQMADDRAPEYITKLKNIINDLDLTNDIIFLGHIGKREQIEILKGSIAIVQPTLFEGGPGGGVTFDATALDLDVILSDIPVNTEISQHPNLTYFKAKDERDLATKMKQALSAPRRLKKSREELISQSENYAKQLGEKLLLVMKFVVGGSN
jgi:glycosyltransferase involved in cell wall biosynthesis